MTQEQFNAGWKTAVCVVIFIAFCVIVVNNPILAAFAIAGLALLMVLGVVGLLIRVLYDIILEHETEKQRKKRNV